MATGKRQTLIKTLFILILCCALGFALLFYSKILRTELTQQIRVTLQEVSTQSSLTLQKEIDGEKNLLIELAGYLGSEGLSDLEASVDGLVETSKRNSFKRMGIILPDGTAYTTDRQVMDLSGRTYFQESMQGNTAYSNN